VGLKVFLYLNSFKTEIWLNKAPLSNCSELESGACFFVLLALSEIEGFGFFVFLSTLTPHHGR